MTLREQLADLDEEILLLDGFDEAFLGLGRRVGCRVVAVYDRDRCLELLVQRDGMSEEEAIEHFDFNVSGAWVGEQTPLFLERVQSSAT